MYGLLFFVITIRLARNKGWDLLFIAKHLSCFYAVAVVNCLIKSGPRFWVKRCEKFGRTLLKKSNHDKQIGLIKYLQRRDNHSILNILKVGHRKTKRTSFIK